MTEAQSQQWLCFFRINSKPPNGGECGMTCNECPNKQEVLKIIDDEYALWRQQQIKADTDGALILATRLEYQLAAIRRIRKKILGMPVDPPPARKG